eukprot:6145230-Prymnesium_polylepis.1
MHTRTIHAVRKRGSGARRQEGARLLLRATHITGCRPVVDHDVRFERVIFILCKSDSDGMLGRLRTN